MSLVPMLFSNWWEDLDRPHRILDQHFGLPFTGELGLRSSPEPEIYVIKPATGRRSHAHYHPYERSIARRRAGGTSTVKADKDKFQVTLDVQQFAPEEVSVKVVDRQVVIEGKHEEKQDEHGWVSRQFVRKYFVPEQCDIDALTSNLSSDGVLSIEAPRKENPKEKKERVIQIEHTGKPAIQDGQPTQNEKPKNAEAQKTPRAQEKSSKHVKAA